MKKLDNNVEEGHLNSTHYKIREYYCQNVANNTTVNVTKQKN